MSKVPRLPRKMKMETSKVLRLARKNGSHVLKTMQKYCACDAECHEVPCLPRKTTLQLLLKPSNAHRHGDLEAQNKHFIRDFLNFSHLYLQNCSPDSAICKNHATPHVWSAAPATQNEDWGLQSAVSATKMELIFCKPCKSTAPVTQNDFWQVMKHVGMSRSAMPATPSAFCSTALGTAIAGSHGRLRTQTQLLANTPSTP